MTRFLAGLTVLLVHTAAASAQQSFPSGADAGFVGPPAPPQKGEAPAAPASPTAAAPAAATPPVVATEPAAPVPQPDSGYPPGYGPPPGYVPPPGFGPRPQPAPPPPQYGAPPPYYGPPATYGYAPPPPRRKTDRPFTIGGNLGMGGLRLSRGGQSSSESGFAYSARLGFGLRPGLILFWDLERSVVDRGSSTFAQTANLAALQMFVGERLFLRVGFGLGQASQDDVYFTSWGPAVMGGLGVELVQGWNWSLDLSSTITAARYESGGREETWLNWSALAFGINFF